MKRSLYLLALPVAFFISCTHRYVQIAVPANVPDSTCDTVNVSYKKDIEPIFNDNCYSCHGSIITKNGDNGLDLEDSASLKQYLEFDFRGDGIYGSKLYHCITHSQYALPMPPNYIMDSCSLFKVKHWLSVGAPISTH